jgi:hypothetical protein
VYSFLNGFFLLTDIAVQAAGYISSYNQPMGPGLESGVLMEGIGHKMRSWTAGYVRFYN